MKILVLNCGSSSIKFQMIETDLQRIDRNDDHTLARGMVDRIGSQEGSVRAEAGARSMSEVGQELPDHQAAIHKVLAVLKSLGAIQSADDIEAIGHRVVHGGDFRASQLITPDVLKKIEDASDLAPLHNPHNLKGVSVCSDLFPGRKQVAVFDTAFHQTMPQRAFLYGLPYDMYRRYKIRRYGFHGTSHRYVAYRFRQLAGRAKEDTSLITCHLGNGCSVCAIQFGRSVDTSMGFTPLEGLVMGTRPGDMDTSIILHLMSRQEMSVNEMTALLNRHSGLLGVSGESNDMRALIESAGAGHERARLAIDLFCYRLKKYVAAYTGVLGQVHGLVFTGGIGENAPSIRETALNNLEPLGYSLDHEKNRQMIGKEGEISVPQGRTRIFVIPTNEELLIARDTFRLIEGVEHD